MVFCPRCGSRQDDSAKFCSSCTQPLTDEWSTRTITHDIVIDGQLAFGLGETVIIEAVSPNPQRPEYRYVVISETLQKKFQLSDGDLTEVRRRVAPTMERPRTEVTILTKELS